jgi:hypothetical protein
MLDQFLRLWPAIQATIISIPELSNIEKNTDYYFSKKELAYLRDLYAILEIFIYPTRLFQAQRYTTLGQAIPHIYRIYIRLKEHSEQDLLASITLFYSTILLYTNLTSLIRYKMPA